MANQHFFQPLLPDFHSHLTIPVAFFLKHMDRNYEKKTAKLRSDASEIAWQVKVEDGLKLTDGWKEFALAHDLRIGDFVVFRQERDMNFHVTIFGPCCCEIQYGSCLEKIPKEEKKAKRNSRRKTESSSLDPSCFMATVFTSTLRYDALSLLQPLLFGSLFQFLPVSFTRMNSINEETKMVLLDQRGRKWSTKLRSYNGGKRIRLVKGWKDCFKANGVILGESITLELIWKKDTSCVLKFCSKVKTKA